MINGNKPLIIPTLYKVVIFTLFVMAFEVIEHLVIGLIHGSDLAKIYQEFVSNGLNAILAKTLVVFVVFILFFAFVETVRVFGEGKLINLFFRKKNKR